MSTKATRMKRALWGTLASIVIGLVSLAVIGVVSTQLFNTPMVSTASAQDSNAETNPRSGYWRAVREGDAGYTTAKTPEAGVLINASGEKWQKRQRSVIPKVIGWLIVIAAVVVLAFYFTKGKLKLDGENDPNRRVLRWTGFERLIHWTMAISFILMTISGLWLSLGRTIFSKAIGMDAVAAGGKAAINIHNYVGPILTIAVLIAMFMWFRDNVLKQVDFDWLKKGGGFGKEHPSAGRMNGGEKIFFLSICTIGVLVLITGFILVFPNVLPSRGANQTFTTLHALLAGVWICIVLGHIYIGTIGTEGALEGMTKGTVSEAWAKQHHDLWYQEQVEHGLVGTPEEIAAARELENDAINRAVGEAEA